MKKFLSSFCYMKNGFSLMEMMIVLLIVSIIAAATAPMIAKKGARSAGGGTNGAISYLGIGSYFGNTNNQDDSTFVLGANRSPVNTARTFLNQRLANDGQPHIILGVNGNERARLFARNNGAITFGNANTSATGQNSIAIGSASAGNTTTAAGLNSIAIGNGATAAQGSSVAIGVGASANNGNEIVISNNTAGSTINIGKAGDTILLAGQQPFRIGENNTIEIGGANTTVVINGHLATKDCLVFGGHDFQYGHQEGKPTNYSGKQVEPGGLMFMSDWYSQDNEIDFSYVKKLQSTEIGTGKDGMETALTRQVAVPNWMKNLLKDCDGNDLYGTKGYPKYEKKSDRRLKNVGKPFTGGLEELKKLDLYNFTFKDDKDKTPHVGVMAQDLQKVFPNAVWEGSDKYLRIRWDEMFYAVINAVKELDNKISEIANQVKSNVDLIQNMQAQIDEQKQINNEQQKTIEALEKRIAKLEKN